MQPYLLAAGILIIVVSTIHSALGEVLIFSRLRNGGLIPTNAEPVLAERRVRILWASWHIVTICGWAFGALLFHLAEATTESASAAFIQNAIIFAMLASSGLVLFATKGKHPGWIGLLGVAVLVWLS